ncbi:hypothetical protein FACS1894219_04770 [Clostridia bacterium]|nr:hypothetical protein FACS1894219_04770 [Clostridia bacterium]
MKNTADKRKILALILAMTMLFALVAFDVSAAKFFDDQALPDATALSDDAILFDTKVLSIATANLTNPVGFTKQTQSNNCKSSAVANALDMITGHNYTDDQIGFPCGEAGINNAIKKHGDTNIVSIDRYDTDHAKTTKADQVKRINASLDKGIPIVAEVKGSNNQHWVVVIGRSGTTYQVWDVGTGKMKSISSTSTSSAYCTSFGDKDGHYGVVSFKAKAKSVTQLSITYNVNGGSISSDKYKVVNGCVGTKLDNKVFVKAYSGSADGINNASTFGLAKKGYKFAGWNTKSDGSGKNFNETSAYKPSEITSASSIVLYATWKFVESIPPTTQDTTMSYTFEINPNIEETTQLETQTPNKLYLTAFPNFGWIYSGDAVLLEDGKIHYISQYNRSGFEFNVYSDHDADVTLRTTYTSGSEARYATIYVNGTGYYDLEFPKTNDDWTTNGTHEMKTSLKQGNNTIKVCWSYYCSYSPDFVKFEFVEN